MAKKALLSHAAGKKHNERDIKIKTFFIPVNQKKIANKNTEFKSAENDNGSSSNSSTHVVVQSCKLVQPTLELVTTNGDKTKAEIIWALKCIESGYSDNSNNDMMLFLSVCSRIQKLLVLPKWDHINCIIL